MNRSSFVIAESEARRLAGLLAPYSEASSLRAAWELVLTAVPFLCLFVASLAGIHFVSWAFLLLALPTGAFLARLFMIQHDCGHGSFFHRRGLNNLLGRAISVLTFTPYGYWRHMHARHHATAGNLDRRGSGDIDVLTIAEYEGLSRWRRLVYRFGRNPLVLFGLGPAYVFLFKQRLPLGLMGRLRAGWLSVMPTNLAIAGFLLGGSLLFGAAFLFVHITTLLVAATSGVWLFYIQHQFKDTHWARDGEWGFYRDAIAGSSHYDLPAPLRWLTANIGIHHIHHLASRIPSYRLGECLERLPELKEVNRLTLRDSLRCARLALWDEHKGALVRFSDAKG
ncbi:Fatty acid desaturase [Rhodospirillaceae bacterium LM-1]|nr:Fatty acid desaturase [Rhodospirillaceae bacterium LM-1]